MHTTRTKGYGQFCPVARTLDLLGDRWTLLIVRDLLRGTARFTDLVGSLKGIPRNLLADRLRTLEAAGLVERRTFREVPPRVEYALTPKGRTLEPVLAALSRWGYEHLLDAPGPGEMDLDEVFARLAHSYRGAPEPGLIAVEIAGAPSGRVGTRYLAFNGGCAVTPEPPRRPDARVTTDLKTWFGLVSGHIDPDEALRAGRLLVEGDARWVRLLPTLFACSVGL